MAEPACYGVVVDVAAVLLGLTGDVSVRAVAFRDCSQYGHDVFGGEQSDASCFVRYGGLRCCWSSSPWCWQVRSERRCRAVVPSGLCKAGRQRALAGCPVRAAKRAAHSSRPSWVGFWCWSVLAGNAEGLSFRRRQPPGVFQSRWSTSAFCYFRVCYGAFERPAVAGWCLRWSATASWVVHDGQHGCCSRVLARVPGDGGAVPTGC